MFESFFSALSKSKTQTSEVAPSTEIRSFFPRPTPRNEGTPEELQERLRNRYIDRLGDRVRKMRRDLASRNWSAIKLEVRQIGASGASYGCGDLAELARKVDQLIPDGEVSKAQLLKEARIETEFLIQSIDAFLNSQA